MDSETCLFYGIIALTFIVIATLIALLIHSGLFTSLDIKTCKPSVGEIKIAYKCGKGAYKNSGLLFTEIHTLLPEYRTLGVYYDDPRKKEESHLRYIVGLVLGENGSLIKTEDEALLKEKEFKFTTFPAINHVVETTFPFSSTLSIIMAVFRVYPALNSYITERNLCAHPFIELYDNEKEKIFFYAPLEKQNQFYVPEISDDDDRQKTDDDIQSSLSFDDSLSSLQREDSVCDSESTNDISSCSIDQEVRASVNESNSGIELIVNDAPVEVIDLASEEKNEAAPVEVKRDDGSDSDNNTISSFEEIEESDVADMPVKEGVPE